MYGVSDGQCLAIAAVVVVVVIIVALLWVGDE